MFRDFFLVIVPSIIASILTTVLNEWRFQTRQKKMLIKEIVENFLNLRKEGENKQVNELLYLQNSGILLLKHEKDAKEVLRQIELRDKPIEIPNFMSNNGILQSIKMLIKNGVDLGNQEEITIEKINEAIKDKSFTF